MRDSMKLDDDELLVLDDEPTLLELVPPEPTFWKKYSDHLEMPLSFMISTLLMTTMFGLLVLFMVLMLSSGPEKKPVPMSLVDGGQDAAGDGSQGGGSGSPEVASTTVPTDQKQDVAVAKPQDLPAVSDDLRKEIEAADPTAIDIAIAPENAKSYDTLNKDLRNKILGMGPGNNPGPGIGDGAPGAGPGGVGSSSTRARSLRWVMRFKTDGGRDYLDQMKALGAIVLVAVPPEKKQMYIFRDLSNPKPGTLATDSELIQFAQQIQFCDPKRESAVSVGQALGLNFTPTEFWAVFPKGIEEELADLEKKYRNRRPDDIEQTVYQVSVIGGRHRLVVSEQTERPRRR